MAARIDSNQMPELSAHRPTAAVALQLFQQFFFSRTDILPVRVKWKDEDPGTWKPCPCDSVDVAALVTAHVLGLAAPRAKARLLTREKSKPGDRSRERRIRREWRADHYRAGSYCPTPDGARVKWTCLDFDSGGHSAPLADARATAFVTQQRCTELQIPSYLECSGGGKGWHLWIFFAEPTPIELARYLGLALAPRDARLENGELADVDKGHGIEVFPKQRTRGAVPLGNMVWLPWWFGAAPGGNLFYRPALAQGGAPGDLVPFLPTSFETVTEEAASAVLARLQAANATSTSTGPADQPDSTQPQITALAVAMPRSIAPAEWKDWKARALEALPLESIYGAWLTDERSGDWIKCRDPDSPSGDRNPSAGVATGTGEAERGAFHSFRTSETVSVFDFMIAHGLASDIREAFRRVAELAHVDFPKRAPSLSDEELKIWADGFLGAGAGAPPPGSPPPGGPTGQPQIYPRIRLNDRQLREIINEAWVHIHTANRQDETHQPSLFRRLGRLARLHFQDATDEDDGAPKIELMDSVDAYGHLARIANWVHDTSAGFLNVMPHKAVAMDIVSQPDRKLPRIDSVVTVPTFDEHGNLVSTPGYHAKSFLWLHLDPTFKMPPVPEAPTSEERDAARSLIVENLLVDFPFVGQPDRANAMAMLLLPFVRRMIRGPTPIHMVEAPTPGTGKTLLVDQLGHIVTGADCPPLTVTADEDEIRKKITSALIGSKQILLLDNITIAIDSGQLAAATTAVMWSDRTFQKQELLEVPNRATWVFTANNPSLSEELARRSIRIRIDAKTDRPGRRKGFKHHPIRDWTLSHRGELVHALLTLVQAWIAAGRPAPKVDALGSFESWTSVIGGVLEHAGIQGFLSNQEEFFDQADVIGAEWREFVEAWHEKFGQQPVKSKDLYLLAEAEGLLGTVLSRSRGERGKTTKVGMELKGLRDKQFGAWRIIGDARKDQNGELFEKRDRQGGTTFMLVPANSTTTPPANEYDRGDDPDNY